MSTNLPEDGADVPSVDAAIVALYGSISFGPGEQPDLGQLRSLFAPGARLTQMQPQGPNTTVEEFASAFEGQLEAGAYGEFREAEIARRAESFGAVAHVFSTYEARFTAGDPPGPPQVARGVNSIQLLRYGGRWWVANMVWDDERPGSPIPAAYLP